MTDNLKTMLGQANELREFFLGTYAEEALTAAMETGNTEIIRLAIQEYASQKQLIEESVTA